MHAAATRWPEQTNRATSGWQVNWLDPDRLPGPGLLTAVGLLARLRGDRAADIVARALLGAAMTLVALALDWRLRRRAR